MPLRETIFNLILNEQNRKNKQIKCQNVTKHHL